MGTKQPTEKGTKQKDTNALNKLADALIKENEKLEEKILSCENESDKIYIDERKIDNEFYIEYLKLAATPEERKEVCRLKEESSDKTRKYHEESKKEQRQFMENILNNHRIWSTAMFISGCCALGFFTDKDKVFEGMRFFREKIGYKAS